MSDSILTEALIQLLVDKNIITTQELSIKTLKLVQKELEGCFNEKLNPILQAKVKAVLLNELEDWDNSNNK